MPLCVVSPWTAGNPRWSYPTPWQQRQCYEQREGLGTLLTQQLIDFAKGYGIKQLYSLGLAEDREMRELANDLGMTIKRDPNNAHQMIYSLEL